MTRAALAPRRSHTACVRLVVMARAASFAALLVCHAYSASALSSPATTRALCYRPTLAVGPKVVRRGSRVYAIASRLRGGGNVPAIGMSFGAAAQWYTSALTAHPLLTKATTLFFISAFSDWNAQNIANRGKAAADPAAPRTPFDPRRTMTFAVMGATFIAPIVHYWFEALNTLAHSSLLEGRPAGVVVLVQTLLDQLLAAPVVLASIFMVIGFYDHVMRAKPFSIRG